MFLVIINGYHIAFLNMFLYFDNFLNDMFLFSIHRENF